MIALSPRRRLGAALFGSALALAAAITLGSRAAAQDVASSPTPPVVPATAEAWSAAAQRDVEAAYRAFVDNHPGMLNPDDPGFPAQLKAARYRGLALGTRVRDGAGYAAALQGFSAGLRDGHALAFASLPAAATISRWPGFVAAWRGDDLRVFGSSLPEAPVGATILDCDGRDVRTLIRENVFGYSGRPEEAGQWWWYATNLFRDDGNPLVTIPQRCRISLGGKVSELTLSWRPDDEQHRAWRRAGRGRATYRSAFDELRRRRSEILAADAVVIDLRGNQGGSSTWSQDAAAALWGSKPVNALIASDPSRVWWRASPGNTHYVSTLVARLQAEGQIEMAESIGRAAIGMKAALDTGEPFWVEPAEPAHATPATDMAPLKTPVYVIVPGYCASACLDALDVFAHLPNTKLIGAPSSADTVYMDVRVETLPGRLAKVVIPNKFYRNRPRASGAVYTPAIEVHDLQWSTAAFLEVVEADLRTWAPRR